MMTNNYRSAAKSTSFAPRPMEHLQPLDWAEAKDLMRKWNESFPHIKQYFNENSGPLDKQIPTKYTEQTIKLPWE